MKQKRKKTFRRIKWKALICNSKYCVKEWSLFPQGRLIFVRQMIWGFRNKEMEGLCLLFLKSLSTKRAVYKCILLRSSIAKLQLKLFFQGQSCCCYAPSSILEQHDIRRYQFTSSRYKTIINETCLNDKLNHIRAIEADNSPINSEFWREHSRKAKKKPRKIKKYPEELRKP